ncbi:iron-sulfur cluster biosynthesis family protein [Brevibacillus choshinensis]|uniref:iron-sulfur cluster biosynthesis family protein n=1 Tax=Brevibacillus choshinensis TaxID=54911 RepID=UPI002E1C7276|nr:iron-sulfur cluster biosynthesis family protein [Brevibacillus choshinensis]
MIIITPHAAARLALLIAEEPDSDKLGIKLIPTTTGCGSFTYSIAITEAQMGDHELELCGIRFLYQDEEAEQLTGTIIDCDATNGRFSIIHPRPLQNDCTHIH